MSQLGGLIQNGILGGIAAGQRDRQMRFQQEQAAIEQQRYGDRLLLEQDQNRRANEEIAMRREQAARLLRQDQADANVLRAAFSASAPAGPQTAGPRPQQVAAEYQNDGGTPEGPGGSGGQLVNVNAQPAAPVDWWASIHPDDLAHASPSVQSLAVTGRKNQLALAQARQEAINDFNTLKANDRSTRFVRDDVWDKWLMYGVPHTEEDMSQSVRDRAINKAETRKQALIDLMTLHPSADGVGPPMIDAAARASLIGLPPELVEDHYHRVWAPQQKAAQTQKILADAYQAVRSAKDGSPEWSSGVATIQANGGSSLLESLLKPKTDPLADDRMRYAVNAAKDDMVRLGKEYADLTGTESTNGTFKPGPMVAPTDEERAMASTSDKDADTGWGDWEGKNDYSIKDVRKARAKVAAWDSYAKARQRYEATAGQMGVGASVAPVVGAPVAAPGWSPQSPPVDHSYGEAYDGGVTDAAPDPVTVARQAVQEFTKKMGRPPTRDEFKKMMGGGQ